MESTSFRDSETKFSHVEVRRTGGMFTAVHVTNNGSIRPFLSSSDYKLVVNAAFRNANKNNVKCFVVSNSTGNH